MAVNSELESLSECLEVLKKKLLKSGKIVVISFHSLEDRIAKQSFKPQPNLIEKKIPIFQIFKISKMVTMVSDISKQIRLPDSLISKRIISKTCPRFLIFIEARW